MKNLLLIILFFYSCEPAVRTEANVSQRIQANWEAGTHSYYVEEIKFKECDLWVLTSPGYPNGGASMIHSPQCKACKNLKQ